MDLARRLEVPVHFLHAWEIPVYAVPDGALTFNVDVMMRVEDALKGQLDALVAKYRGRGVEPSGRVREGLPAIEVVRAVEELSADLVVMGTHGRTGLSHLVLGSVAERVVRTCPVPVLTVPRPKDAKK